MIKYPNGMINKKIEQIKDENCIPEERLGYDLYYVKHRTLFWELSIFIQYVAKVLSGRMKG